MGCRSRRMAGLPVGALIAGWQTGISRSRGEVQVRQSKRCTTTYARNPSERWHQGSSCPRLACPKTPFLAQEVTLECELLGKAEGGTTPADYPQRTLGANRAKSLIPKYFTNKS